MAIRRRLAGNVARNSHFREVATDGAVLHAPRFMVDIGQTQLEALSARRRREPFAARLYLEGDLPEFYRWTRVMTSAQMATVLRVAGAVPTEVRVLERAQQPPLFHTLELTTNARRDLRDVLKLSLAYHLEARPKSQKFLDEVRDSSL